MKISQEQLVIKRYASRRLYNTESSDYVTLQEVAEFIRAGRDVKIVDLKTGEDLTRQYLIQIIADHEAKGDQLLPLDVLTEIVRSYNDQAKDVVPRFLDMSFEILKQSQSQVLDSVKSMADPMYAFKEFERRQKEVMAAMTGGWPAGRQKGYEEDSERDSNSEESELEKIRKQLADLQSRISNL